MYISARARPHDGSNSHHDGAGLLHSRGASGCTSIIFASDDSFAYRQQQEVGDRTSQLVATRAELATLQEPYDALRADRDRLDQTSLKCSHVVIVVHLRDCGSNPW